MEQSLQATIESALIGAKNAHHLAVEQGTENDNDWPRFYAEFIVRRLVPLMTAFQSEHYPHSDTCQVTGYSGKSLPPSEQLAAKLDDKFGGPGWIAGASIPLTNCHDSGDC